jgi:hypothetical protein
MKCNLSMELSTPDVLYCFVWIDWTLAAWRSSTHVLILMLIHCEPIQVFNIYLYENISLVLGVLLVRTQPLCLDISWANFEMSMTNDKGSRVQYVQIRSDEHIHVTRSWSWHVETIALDSRQKSRKIQSIIYTHLSVFKPRTHKKDTKN